MTAWPQRRWVLCSRGDLLKGCPKREGAAFRHGVVCGGGQAQQHGPQFLWLRQNWRPPRGHIHFAPKRNVRAACSHPRQLLQQYRHLDRLGPELGAAERRRVVDHCRTSARYEWMFWDAALRDEAWPLSDLDAG